jgi:hypothetical protein
MAKNVQNSQFSFERIFILMKINVTKKIIFNKAKQKHSLSSVRAKKLPYFIRYIRFLLKTIFRLFFPSGIQEAIIAK